MFKNIQNLKSALETKKETYWQKRGEEMALRLFRLASLKVPAYKDFLNKNKVDSIKIKSISDFASVPPVSKKNYLRAYPWEKLCWNGNPGSMDMISVSSGSTGEPFYWLRGRDQEKESLLAQQLYFLDSFEVDKRSTLVIMSFAMGVWVGGTVIYRGSQDTAGDYNMSVVTPGINILEILKIVRSIGGKYDQIILAGYPPFVKDVIDQGETSGVEWKKYNVKFLFAAEAFSEKWRDYMYEKTGSKNHFKDSLNIYGTADALIMGNETPLSIFIRRTADKNSGLYKALFAHEERAPTLVQYNPAFKYFEDLNGDLLFTNNSGIPLVRYEIGDTGGVITHGKMIQTLSEHRVNLTKEAKESGISNWQIPFLFVYGRKDFMANLYGANIYPENIKDALSFKEISEYASGKFVMMTRNDKNLNQYLETIIELKNGIKKYPSDFKVKIANSIVKTLKLKNNEFAELYKLIGKKAEPEVKLCGYADERFFKAGVKQKWHKT